MQFGKKKHQIFKKNIHLCFWIYFVKLVNAFNDLLAFMSMELQIITLALSRRVVNNT